MGTLQVDLCCPTQAAVDNSEEGNIADELLIDVDRLFSCYPVKELGASATTNS